MPRGRRSSGPTCPSRTVGDDSIPERRLLLAIRHCHFCRIVGIRRLAGLCGKPQRQRDAEFTEAETKDKMSSALKGFHAAPIQRRQEEEEESEPQQQRGRRLRQRLYLILALGFVQDERLGRGPRR